LLFVLWRVRRWRRWLVWRRFWHIFGWLAVTKLPEAYEALNGERCDLERTAGSVDSKADILQDRIFKILFNLVVKLA
jgi:hypothetical protein